MPLLMLPLTLLFLPAAMIYLDVWEKADEQRVALPSQYKVVLRSNVTLTKPLVRGAAPGFCAAAPLRPACLPTRRALLAYRWPLLQPSAPPKKQ